MKISSFTSFYRLIGAICALIVALASNSSGQENWALGKTNLNDQNELRSQLEVPYDVMVADLDASSENLHSLYKASLKINDSESSAKCFELLGIVKYLKAEYDSSTIYNLKAIELFHQLHLPIREGAVLCSQGYQMKRRDLKEAFDYFKKGLAILKQYPTDIALFSAYDNYGVLFEMDNQIDSAVFYYSIALERKIEIKDSIAIPFSLNKIGASYLIKKDPNTALTFFQKAYDIRLKRNDTFGILENQSFFGDAYLELENYKEAAHWYQMSADNCTKSGYRNQRAFNLEQLSFCYQKMDNPALALSYLRDAQAIKDSILTENNTKAILDIEKKYQSAEKDKSILSLEKKANERKLYTLIVAISLSLALALVVVYFQIQRRKQKAKLDLSIIQEREAGLRAVFEATETERRRIAKDLHDGIGQQLGGLKLHFQKLRNPNQTSNSDNPHIAQLTEIIDDACDEIRSISHQMMPKALIERGLLPALEDLFKKQLPAANIQYSLEHFNIESARLDPKIETALFRAAQEITSNIIKHSQANAVSIQLLRNKKFALLIVEDNGVGLPKDLQSGGIGLLNIQSRVQLLSGDATWSNGPEKGTVVTIRIPIQ
jgi:two-component system, NarL family, sensor kinase